MSCEESKNDDARHSLEAVTTLTLDVKGSPGIKEGLAELPIFSCIDCNKMFATHVDPSKDPDVWIEELEVRDLPDDDTDDDEEETEEDDEE